MRHYLASALPIALLLLIIPGTLAAQDDPDMPAAAGRHLNKETYLRLRAAHTATLRGLKTPVPPYARIKAIQLLEKQERTLKASSPISSQAWQPIGPAPIPNGLAYSVDIPTSGRVTAIAVHPTDANKVYVGTAYGGVYRSLDGGATWAPIMDQALSLAVGSLAIDPSNPTRLWVGTGESNLSGDSYYGVGLYRITNAESAAPTLEGPFDLDAGGNDVFTNTAVAKVLIHPSDPNTVFVATGFGSSPFGGFGPSVPPLGLYRTQNALAASPRFTRLAVPPGATSTEVGDAILEPGNPDHLLCSTLEFSNPALSGVWRTTNANAAAPSFVRTLPLPLSARGMFAANKIGSTVKILLGAGDPANSVRCPTTDTGTLRQSTDGGQTWSEPLPAAAGFCGGCTYDQAVAIDPNNSSQIYLGGGFDGTNCSITYTRSTDGGQTFSAARTIDSTLHADTHAIVPAPSNPSIVYLGSDGGIFKSTDHGQSWVPLNNSQFSATQFYSLALHPTDREVMIGGTQDNGTLLRQTDASWTLWVGSDGGFTVIDSSASSSTVFDLYGTFFNIVGSMGFLRAGSTTCAAQQSFAFRGCGFTPFNALNCEGVPYYAANGLNCNDSAVLFFAPLVSGPGRPNPIYFGTDRLYRSSNRGETMTPVSQQLQSEVAVSAIGIAPSDDRVRLVGLANGRLFLTTNASTTLTDVTGAIPPLFIARIVIDPSDSAVAYVTLDGYTFKTGQAVWKTTNLTSGHPTWQPAGNGIPDIPVNAFTIDPANSQHLFAGTDIGVYASLNGGAQWLPFSNGLPRVPVFDIAFQGTHRVLRIATHGRGIWEITPPVAALLPCVPGPTVLCLDEQAGDKRWKVQVAYDAGASGSGSGTAVPLASLGVSRGGLFWFFSAENPEMLIKVLNACTFNQKFWVFYAAGTDVGLTTTVTDTKTGTSKTYTNTRGQAAPPVEDTSAFDCQAGDALTATDAEMHQPLPTLSAAAGCTANATTLCIDGRYKIQVTYQASSLSGSGNAIPLTSLGVTHGGLFWFFGAENPEMLIKVLDACTFNQKHWVFFSATTDVGFRVTVNDTMTGATATYTNTEGTPARPVLDVVALPCP
ncbi:MAG TPA: hypothetical protein VF173_01580 [Thermoanaerobaculia bacterium]|nr:hypothetical protein [Thermoanaerobaculia bacterium]